MNDMNRMPDEEPVSCRANPNRHRRDRRFLPSERRNRHGFPCGIKLRARPVPLREPLTGAGTCVSCSDDGRIPAASAVRFRPLARLAQPSVRRSSRSAQRILALLLAVLSLLMLAGAFAQQTPPAAANTAPAAVEEDIRDIRGPISIPYPWLWATYAGGGLLLLALAYAAWRWYHRSSAARAKAPFEIALERLEKARALMQPETAREYSFEVSEVVRGYIEQRFDERAARRTTEEFLRDLLAHSGSELAPHRALLDEFLRHCDLAKLARWQLSMPQMESMHESARAFIEQTKPTPAKAPASNSLASTNGATPQSKTTARAVAPHHPSCR